MKAATRFAIVRDATIGGRKVFELARLGRKIDNDPYYPRYNVQFLDDTGKLREASSYERTVLPTDIFQDFVSARAAAAALQSN